MLLAEEFVTRKRPTWERLNELLTRSRQNAQTLSAEELHELGLIYRQTTSDLAVARRDYTQHPVTIYLNELVARAHAHIYRGKTSRLSQLGTFFSHTFPHTFRTTWHYTFASFLMFLLPALVCAAIAYHNPDTIITLFPDVEPTINNIKTGKEWWHAINDEGNASSASFIMTNNIRVAFLAFAGGVLFGILTLHVLVNNGILLGSVAGAAQHYNFADNLWGFIAAHGVIELSVIFIAGGAGLQLGWSLLCPGVYTRRAALVLASRRAVRLIFGCIPLLIIAGTIEGFISPSALPLVVKLLVALLSGVLLSAYFIVAGKNTTVHTK